MKTEVRWVVVALVMALMSGVAWAELKGRSWVDKKFETYNVKKIALTVSGTWDCALARVEPEKMGEYVTAALERKGYEVVVRKKAKGEEEEPVDATLKVVYRSLFLGRGGVVDMDSKKASEMRDYNVSGSAVLSLATGTKKVIFRAQAGTEHTIQDAGPAKDGGRYIDILDPAQAFAEIVKPIPSRPEAKEKESEGVKEKKEESGKKDQGEK